MNLTKRHFKVIAKIIKNEVEGNPNQSYYILTKRLGEYFHIENPRFDIKKFIEACGV